MIQQHRDTIIQILNHKDPRLLVVCGPCSIHDYPAAMEYAKNLKQLSEEFEDKLFIVMRTYFAKPRTQGGWKGFINDPYLSGSPNITAGIKLARSLLQEINDLNMPCATEFLDPFMADYFSDLISWGAIGARTVESQLHREMASNLTVPIAFKNNTSGDIQAAVDACVVAAQPHGFIGIKNNQAEIINTRGNVHSHIILRGAKQFSNYDRESVKQAEALLEKADLPRRIMIDCSHGNSGKDHAKQIDVARDVAEQIAANSSSIIGVMLESNLIAGKQTLSNKLIYGQSITDACVDLKTTETIFKLLASGLELKHARYHSRPNPIVAGTPL